ncbi:mevalonate kinase [Candidatus Daviesbacteria bacterium]|nr:mevalonate kinase [Candidatus Daviesbacteria bacterium]
MIKQVQVSAPGKLMLFGEHAVLYGRPCIVTAVGQRMKATVTLTDEPIFELNAPDVAVVHYQKLMHELGRGEIPKGAKFVEMAVYNFYNNYKSYIKESGIQVTTTSDFSSQFGFGSSSAATVCVIKALSQLTGSKLSNKAIFDLSYLTVLDIQGKGSGFDVAAAVYGGTLYFVIGGKVIKPLNLPYLPLIVGYSGIKADTVDLINQVSRKAAKFPKVIDDIYTSIGELVLQAKKAILKQDWETLGELMYLNQGYLSALGVSSGKLESMIHAAREAGAYGAKLSGAGGGDCMIALAPSKSKNGVEEAINKAGGQTIDVKTNVPGVRIEK